MPNARAGRAHVIALGLSLAALSCSDEAGRARGAFDAEALRVDDTGQRLTPSRSPERIVSLIPAATEILFALGAGPSVVARTDYCDYPPEVRRLPSVGNGIRPALEPILALRPDLVVLFAGPDNAAVLERLRALHVPVFAIRHNTMGDLERNIRRLGALVDRTTQADSLVRMIRAGLDSVARIEAARSPTRVYYDLWGDPPHTVGGGSYVNDLIRIAGGQNVFGRLDRPSPRVNLEAIIAAGPEVVLVGTSDAGVDPVSRLRARPGWSAVRAVREGRVAVVNADLVHRLGPRLPAAAEALAAAIAAADRAPAEGQRP